MRLSDSANDEDLADYKPANYYNVELIEQDENGRDIAVRYRRTNNFYMLKKEHLRKRNRSIDLLFLIRSRVVIAITPDNSRNIAYIYDNKISENGQETDGWDIYDLSSGEFLYNTTSVKEVSSTIDQSGAMFIGLQMWPEYGLSVVAREDSKNCRIYRRGKSKESKEKLREFDLTGGMFFRGLSNREFKNTMCFINAKSISLSEHDSLRIGEKNINNPIVYDEFRTNFPKLRLAEEKPEEDPIDEMIKEDEEDCFDIVEVKPGNLNEMTQIYINTAHKVKLEQFVRHVILKPLRKNACYLLRQKPVLLEGGKRFTKSVLRNCKQEFREDQRFRDWLANLRAGFTLQSAADHVENLITEEDFRMYIRELCRVCMLLEKATEVTLDLCETVIVTNKED
jgi:hypothetical protein